MWIRALLAIALVSATVVPAAAGGDPEEWTALLAAARDQERVCGGETFAPAASLAWDVRLAAAASAHSRDMAENRRLNHTGSGGETLTDRIAAVEFRARAWGENIAAGQPDAAAVVEAWLESAGHCANIMQPEYSRFGAAVEAAEDGTPYWTLVLAAPAG